MSKPASSPPPPELPPEVGAEWWLPFADYLAKERRYSPYTLRNYRQAFEDFYRWLAETGVDVVIVDCPPALAAATATALASASAVLMPVRPDPFAHEGLVNTWYEIKRIRESINVQLGSAGILLTMSGSEATGDDVAQVIRAEFGEQVYAVEIATDPKVAEAAQLSLPVAVLDPDGLAGRAYVDAAQELLNRLERQNRAGTHLRPALGRDEALNRLREWRAITHAALLRMPSSAEGWAKRASRASGEAEDDDDYAEDDDYFGVVTPPKPPSTGRKLGLWPLLAALALGMGIEAVTGLLRSLIQGWL